MPDPMLALQKAQSIGADPSAPDPSQIKLGMMPLTPGDLPLFSGMAQKAEEYSPFLKNLFQKNPLAEQLYKRAMASQAPEVMAANEAQQAAKMQQLQSANSSLKSLAEGGVPRPIPTDNGWATAIPNTPQAPPRPMAGGGPNTLGLGTQFATGVSNQFTKIPPAVRNTIRSMPLEQAIQHFPNIPIEILKSLTR